MILYSEEHVCLSVIYLWNEKGQNPMALPLLSRRGAILHYDREQGLMRVLDYRRYPHETVFVECPDLAAVIQAIKNMSIQDGLSLAYAAGYGLALVARQRRTWPIEARRATLIQATGMLRKTQPTAHDLHTMLINALAVADTALVRGADPEQALADFVDAQVAHDDQAAEACGRHAATLFNAEERVLTHSFAGAALNWMLYIAHEEQGKQVHLYVTETRPTLLGARLTTHQAAQIGVRVTLLTDTMPGTGFNQGMFTAYITAADRIALDGSIANHVGTYPYAVLAARHHIPFYVLGYNGPDPGIATGDDISIKERDPSATLLYADIPTTPVGVKEYCSAFDVIPPEFITAIVTERGIFAPQHMRDYHRS